MNLRVLPALALLCCSTALADDWAVRRSPFDARLVGRYKAMLARRPDDGYALDRLVRLYRKHRSFATLIAEYRAAARARPDHFALQVVLGHLYRRAGKVEEAIACYERAARIRPKSGAAAAALGALYRRQKQDDKASEAYRRALELARTPREKVRYLRALANIALGARDIEAARAHYRRLVRLQPHNMLLRLELAQALARSGNRTEALQAYQEVYRRTKDTAARADILKEIGSLQNELGQADKAVATYRKAMALAARGHWIRRELTERIIAIHRRKDQLKLLIAHYEKTWRRRGHFEHDILGRLYDETGDETRAMKAYRAALRRSPHAIETRVRLIALLERSGREKEVIAEYRRLARIAPGEPRYQLELAKRLFRAGHQGEATVVLERCGRRFPGDASVHSALADLYARWGDQRRAMREAQVLVRIEPKDDAHLVNLGEQYYLAGQKRKAVETWKRLLTVIRERDKANARLAEILGQHDMIKEALELYRKAIRLNPQAVAYRKSLAMLLEHKKKTSEALKAWHAVHDLARRQKLARTRREARTHITNILHRTYQLRSAMRGYRQRFEQDPPDLEAGFLLAEAHLKRRSPSQAVKVYRRMLELQPDNIEVLSALEEVYRRQRRLADAVVLLKRLAGLQPGRAPEYFQRIADLQLQLYNDDEALRYAHKALALGARDARSHQRLGELYEKKEDFDAAIRAYLEALRLDPNYHSVRFALGRLHTRRGDYDKAERLYREVIRSARAPEVIRKAFRAGVDLSSYLGRLELLEKEIQPRAVAIGNNAALYRELLVEIYQRRVPRLLHRARHGRAKARAEAQAALRRIGLRGLAPLLEQLASTRHATTARQQLIRLLGYLDNPNAVLPLLRLAQSSPEQNPVTIYGHRSASYSPYDYARVAAAVNERVEAIVAVGRLGDQRSIPGLIELMSSGEGAIRGAAAWALGQLRQRKVSPALFAALGDRQVAVQAMACAGLGLQGDPKLRPVLEEVVLDPARDEHVRAACAWALGALGDPAAVPGLARVMRSGDDELQRCAAWSLGAIADRRATSALTRALWTKRPGVRQAMVQALVRIGQGRPLAVQQTPEAIIDQGRIAIRPWVARLGKGVTNGKPRAVANDLASFVVGHQAEIGEGIELALGRHRDVVLRVLRDLDAAPGRLTLGPLTPDQSLLKPATADELSRALASIGKHIIQTIEGLVDHPDTLVAQRALSVYAKLALGNRAEDRLVRALADPRDTIRVAALRAMKSCHARGVIDDAQLLKIVGTSWKSRRWREREAAIAALGRVRLPPASIAARRALAGDPNAFVREAAARALGGQGGPGALAALLAALNDDVAHVRAAACQALQRLGARPAIPRLRKLLEDPETLVRRAAAQALQTLAR